MKTFALIDERHVEDSRFLQRTQGKPYLKRREPILRAEGTSTVLRDECTGLWRMWYTFIAGREPKVDVVSIDNLICYAESRDGLNWEFPKLNLVKEKGLPKGACEHNIVIGHHQRDRHGRYITGYAGPTGFCVIDAQATPHPAARGRFTAMYNAYPTDSYGGILLAYSDDGVRWTGYTENPVIPGSQDTQNNILYDPRIGRYVCFQRPGIYCGVEFHANRKLARSESTDLVNWSPSRVVLDTDDLDASAHDFFEEPGMGGVRGRIIQIFGISPFIYHGCYVGHLWVYNARTANIWSELVHSDDGIHWKREPVRRPFIDEGRPEGLPGKLVRPVDGGPVVVGDEHYMYMSMTPYDHHITAANDFNPDRSKINQMNEHWDLYAVAIKRDRWIGYEAISREGEFLSTPFEWTKPSPLLLNASIAADGYIKVEAEDQWGRPVKDLHLDEIQPVNGPADAVDIPVVFGPGPKSIWKLPPIGPVRLRMRLKNATLFGWTIEAPAIELPARDTWGPPI